MKYSGSTSTSTLAPQNARKLTYFGATECTRAPAPKWKGVNGIDCGAASGSQLDARLQSRASSEPYQQIQAELTDLAALEIGHSGLRDSKHLRGLGLGHA